MADDLNELTSDKAPLDPGGLAGGMNPAQRQLMFNGIGQIGALLLAAGQKMMPADRAKYLAQIGAVPGQMQDQALKYRQMEMMDQYRRAQAQQLLMDTRLKEEQLKNLQGARDLYGKIPAMFGTSPSAGGAVSNIAAGGGAPAPQMQAAGVPDGAALPSSPVSPSMPRAASAPSPSAAGAGASNGGNWGAYQNIMSQAALAGLNTATAHLVPVLEKHAANVLGRDAWQDTILPNGLPGRVNVITGEKVAYDQVRIERIRQAGPNNSVVEELVPSHQAAGRQGMAEPNWVDAVIPGVGPVRIDANRPEARLPPKPMSLDDQVAAGVQAGGTGQAAAQPAGVQPNNVGPQAGQNAVPNNPIVALAEVNRAKATGTQSGDMQARLSTNAPQAFEASNRALKLISDVATDPNLGRSTGMLSFTTAVPGTGGYDFAAKVNQLRGAAFREGIQMMVGLGALSDKEGAAALASVTRLDLKLSQAEFKKALGDLNEIINAGRARAEGYMRISPPGTPGAYAPASAPQQAAQPQILRWNPATGKVE